MQIPLHQKNNNLRNLRNSRSPDNLAVQGNANYANYANKRGPACAGHRPVGFAKISIIILQKQN